MSQSFYVALVIALALIAANVPFRANTKALKWRLVELLIGYAVVIVIGLAIESHLGKTTGQGWEFYAITFALFISFAFPGFVIRYLLRGVK